MSASQEKKARAQRLSEGTDKKRNAADEKEKRAQKFRRNTIIAVVCIVLVVAAAIVINSSLFYTGLTAVTVGDTRYSAAEVNVFYRNTFNTIYSNFGDYASYLVDASTPLSEQQYSENQTWADYVYDETLERMRQVTALYDAAVADGAPTEEDLNEVAEQMSTISLYAQMNGASNENQFLASVYGRGVNTKVYESVLTKMIVAQNYSTAVSEGFSYTQEEKDAWYAENADSYDVISYYSYFVGSDNEAFASIEGDDAKKEAAHAAAEEIAAPDAEAFIANAQAFDAEAAPAEQYTQGSSLSYYDYGEWLLDANRKAGDATVVDTDGGAYALLYTGRDANDYYLTAMRHILIEAEADENGEYTDVSKEAARARIHEITAEWQADPTEDRFAELANEYSEDEGSNTNGGLYENITKHRMVDGIDSFLFEEGSKPGDTAVIDNDGSYVGTHLVYYVGAHDALYKDEIADSQLRGSDYSAYLEDLTANYTAVAGSGLRFATLH